MNRTVRFVANASLAALALVAVACGGSTETAAPAPAAQPAPAPAAAPATPEAAAITPAGDVVPPAADAAGAPVDAAAAAVAAPVDVAAMTAILATADLADGKTDMTVSKCAGCKLGMDGKAEHSSAAHGYTLHFCSTECKTKSDANLDAVIVALK